MKTVTQRAACAIAPALLLLLTACGGGGGSDEPSFIPTTGGGGSTTGTGGGTTGGTGGGTTGGTGVVVIGSVQSGTFVEGQVAIGVNTLSAGGVTEITVNLVDDAGNPAPDPNSISFTSDCVADGTAMLTASVSTINGQATAEYTAQGCVGADEIRASTTISGTTITAIGTVQVEQDDIGSIEFVSAEPSQIALAGTGGVETSRVTFRVLGQAGGPIQDANVDFALNSTIGGLSISPESAVSNTNGEVSTIISAGSISAPARITATETSSNISTQSSELVISTGIPDFDSFSLSRSIINPEGFDFDGEESEVTIRAADAFNNPVPDGTAISFFAEGGSIDSSCTTTAGACSVTWRSQSPRPDNGIVTILASAIGNESFTDQNGNGRFDDGEPFTDIGEAFADNNDNDTFDLGEFFVDFGPNGTPDGARNDADTEYNGVLCSDTATTCSDDRSVTVFDSVRIIMSGSTATITLLGSADPLALTTSANGFTVQVEDENGNSMPSGTTIDVSVSQGYTLGGDNSVTVGNAVGPASLGITLAATAGSVQTTGILTVEVVTPNDVRTVAQFTLGDA